MKYMVYPKERNACICSSEYLKHPVKSRFIASLLYNYTNRITYSFVIILEIFF